MSLFYVNAVIRRLHGWLDLAGLRNNHSYAIMWNVKLPKVDRFSFKYLVPIRSFDKYTRRFGLSYVLKVRLVSQIIKSTLWTYFHIEIGIREAENITLVWFRWV